MIHRPEKWTGKQWHKPMIVWRHKTSLGSLLARKSFWVSRPGADGRVSRPSRRTWLMLIDADSQSNNCFIVCSSIGSHLCFFSSLLSLPSLAPTQTNQAIRCDYRSRPTALDTSSEIWRHQTLSAQPSATSGLDANHWAQSVKSLPDDLLPLTETTCTCGVWILLSIPCAYHKKSRFMHSPTHFLENGWRVTPTHARPDTTQTDCGRFLYY